MGHTLDQNNALWNRPEELVETSVEICIVLVARDCKARHRDVAIVKLYPQCVIIQVILIIMAFHRQAVIGLMLCRECGQ